MKFLVWQMVIFASLSLAGCGGKKTSKPSSHSAPAEVMQISDELELASVRLSADAEKRLGITVSPVKMQEVLSRRPYPGVVVVPPQSQSVLLAPVAGVVQYGGARPLSVGTAVSRGQSLFSLTPIQAMDSFLMGPAQRDQLKLSRITIEQSAAAIQSRIDLAKAELTAAGIERKRSEQLFKDKVGSRKRVDDTIAREKMAQQTLEAAKREQQTLKRVDREIEMPTASAPSPLSQVSPLTGSILRVQVASGQSVSAGQPLLELVNLDRLWIRVRIPQGEATTVLRTDDALVSLGSVQVDAEPVKGPPTADQTTSTLDLYYSLQNSGDSLNPDQRVEVSLPLKGSKENLVVPTASVLYDIHGGTWVYTRTEPLMYRRVRVQIDLATDEGQTMLLKGPGIGTEVVVDGAAEIFGIEFGND